MKNPIRSDVMRRAVDRLIQTQPIHCQFWVIVSGDGISDYPQYAFSYSYVGAIADAGRQVFKDMPAAAEESISKKSVVVILPYTSGKPIPTRGAKLILYDMAGNQYAKVWVNTVISYNVGTIGNTSDAGIYKIEIHASIDQG